jgi:hypothetical protein
MGFNVTVTPIVQEVDISASVQAYEVEVVVNSDLIKYAEEAKQSAEESEASALQASQSASDALASENAAQADATATAADRVQTGLDRTATGQDRVATGQDRVATGADRVQTGLDRTATGADRVQTGIDANTATTQAGIATTQANTATTQAGIATTQAGIATTQAGISTTQAGISTTQAGISTTQAGIATTQAGNALTSANNAAASASAAAQVGTSTLLTGFSVGANTAIAGTDSILQAFNKTQGQINARVSSNIYSANGTLAGARSLTLGGFSLDFIGTITSRFFANGNIGIGTTTDAGFRLDVAGSTRLNGLQTFQGTTASDTAPLGSELTTTGSGTNWTGSAFATGYTHVVGSTAPLTTSTPAVSGTYYQIAYTVTGRTAGSITINYGGTSTSGITATGVTGPLASSTANLEIVPTTDFDGTVVLSVRSISNSSATTTFTDSGGTNRIQIRANSSNNNTLVGLNAGRRITTATGNSIFGSNAGLNNTTGTNNSFFGLTSGNNNSIGISNSFFGVNSGFNNTTGSNNSFFGRDSGRLIANGSNLTIANNSVFLGFDTRANADNETNQTVIGYQAIGLGSNTTVIGNSSTTFGRWWGNLLLGTSTNSTFLLDVNGTARFSNDVTIADTRNIILSTTTGTRIGTATNQRLALWNATPNVQPTNAITAAAFVANTSGIVNDTATFGGYTIGQIVAALQRIGALA